MSTDPCMHSRSDDNIAPVVALSSSSKPHWPVTIPLCDRSAQLCPLARTLTSALAQSLCPSTSTSWCYHLERTHTSDNTHSCMLSALIPLFAAAERPFVVAGPPVRPWACNSSTTHTHGLRTGSNASSKPPSITEWGLDLQQACG